MKKFFFVVAAFITGSQLSAQSEVQEDTVSQSLGEVVLTASKTPLKQSQTGKVVTVIDQQTIANNVGRTISELLNTQAGIFINGANNNPGTNTDLYLRGAGSGNTLIIVDGIPVFDPAAPTSKTIDLNNISLDQVERIEIVKGGQSTIWGSDAIAGVVQIFLKKNAGKKLALNGGASYGSFNTFRANAGISGTIHKLGYRLQYGYTGSDGFSVAHDSTGNKDFDKDEFRQHTVMAEVNYKLNNGLLLRLFENYSTYKAGLDGGAFTDDNDYTTRNKNNLTGVGLKYHRQQFSWNLLATYQRMSRLMIDDSIDISSPYSNYSKGQYSGSTVNLESYINQTISKKIELVAGLQYVNQYSDQSYLSIGSFGPYESKIGKDSVKANHSAAFASFVLKDLDGFNLEAGARFNHHSIYGTNATFTFNPSYAMDRNTKVFINISSGYRIPTLYQLYGEFGNRDLEPEHSITYEFGVQTLSEDKKIQLRLVGYKRDSKELIAFGATNYINRDEQHDYGFEVESKIAFSNWGNWVNNLGFVDGSGIEDGVKVENLYRRPKFTLSSTLSLSPIEKLVLMPSFRYTGSRLKNPFDIGPEEQPHYYTLDFFTSYSIKHVRLFLDFRNITDQVYFDIPGYTSKRFNMTGGVSFNF
jgi:vitamin B12 transporter